MKLGWRPYTITAGVWRLFLVAGGAVLAYLAALIWNVSLSTSIATNVRQATAFSTQLRIMGEDLLNAETGQRGYLLTGSNEYLAPYFAGATEVQRRFDNARALTIDKHLLPSIEALSLTVTAKLREMAETIELAEHGRRDEALRVVNTGRGRLLMDDFRQLRTDIMAQQDQYVAARRTEYLSTINNLLLASISIAAAALAVLLFTTLHTSARLRRPIEALLAGMRIVASGDLEHRVPVSGKDEVGRLAEAFNDMAQQNLDARRAREAVQAELERSNAELDSFAYVASHDLKAPLRGIRNLAEWITEDLGDHASDETKENLSLLRGRVDRLDGLLESLLEYSRVGRRSDAVETVDSAQLVTDIAQYLAPREGFAILAADGMPRFDTARVPLEKVLRNLINNALKHHDRDQGTVTVTAMRQDGFVKFRVADDGPGIPREFHEKIFQMFQTLRPRDEVEGSGMGLAIVKKTVESAGGKIRVESDHPSRGTAFVFTWPEWNAKTAL
jgi:signal transduction histidine kinase